MDSNTLWNPGKWAGRHTRITGKQNGTATNPQFFSERQKHSSTDHEKTHNDPIHQLERHQQLSHHLLFTNWTLPPALTPVIWGYRTHKTAHARQNPSSPTAQPPALPPLQRYKKHTAAWWCHTGWTTVGQHRKTGTLYIQETGLQI